jgi:hypothetical protein
MSRAGVIGVLDGDAIIELHGDISRQVIDSTASTVLNTEAHGNKATNLALAWIGKDVTEGLRGHEIT